MEYIHFFVLASVTAIAVLAGVGAWLRRHYSNMQILGVVKDVFGLRTFIGHIRDMRFTSFVLDRESRKRNVMSYEDEITDGEDQMMRIEEEIAEAKRRAGIDKMEKQLVDTVEHLNDSRRRRNMLVKNIRKNDRLHPLLHRRLVKQERNRPTLALGYRHREIEGQSPRIKANSDNVVRVDDSQYADEPAFGQVSFDGLSATS